MYHGQICSPIQWAVFYDKMFNVRNYQRDTNKNYKEISPLTPVRMAIINKSTSKCWRGCGEGDPSALLVGMQTGAATVGKSTEFPPPPKKK